MFRKIILLENCVYATSIRSASLKANTEGQLTSKELLLKLRNSSGYPLINCREALAATNYDINKAKEHLLNLAKEKGWRKMTDISQKLNQGLICVAKSKTSAAIVEVNCATDFVAKTTDFQKLVKEAADIALQNFSTDGKLDISVDEILGIAVSDKSQTLADQIALTIGKLKESVQLRRACLITTPPGGTIGAYIHPCSLINASKPGSLMGTFAALASISSVDDERTPTFIKARGRDICQHIVAMMPVAVGEETKPKATEASSGDSAELQKKSYVEISDLESSDFPPPDSRSDELLRQPFLLDTDISVEQWLELSDVKVHDFIRFQVGECNEKKTKDDSTGAK